MKINENSTQLLYIHQNITYWYPNFNASEFYKFIENYNRTHHLMESSLDFEECDDDCLGILQYAAVKYGKNYHVFAALVMCIFGMLSNIINIIVLTRKELAAAPINRILTALAMTDILIMMDYIPFAYYYYIELPDKLNFPYLAALYMLFHMHFSHILHTVSICLTIMLAVWRYLAIGYPEQTQILCTSKRCNIGILISYILAILLCTPMYLTFKIGSTIIIEDKKYTLYVIKLSELAKKHDYLVLNFWLYAVLIKLLPCCLLTIISIWLIRTLFAAKQRKQKLKSYSSSGDRAKVKLEKQTRRTTKMLVAILLLFLTTEFPQGIFSLIIGMFGKCVFLKCYQDFGEVMDILALINGSITFILYCWMNKMFRTTFTTLFKGNMRAIWKSSGNSDVYTTSCESKGLGCNLHKVETKFNDGNINNRSNLSDTTKV